MVYRANRYKAIRWNYVKPIVVRRVEGDRWLKGVMKQNGAQTRRGEKYLRIDIKEESFL